MKSKIKKVSGTLLASLACLTVGSIGNISPVHASCENAPASGSQFKMTGPDTFKLRTTFQTFIDTKNARKLNLALTRADRQAQFDLSEFFKGVFNGDLDVDADGQAEWLIGEQDMVQKDIAQGFENAKRKFNTQVKNFDIPGTRKVGQCVDPGNQIVVTREISSEQIFAANSATTLKNESTQKDDDVAANETIVSEENKGPKAYKSQVSGGYDGYADMEEF